MVDPGERLHDYISTCLLPGLSRRAHVVYNRRLLRHKSDDEKERHAIRTGLFRVACFPVNVGSGAKV